MSVASSRGRAVPLSSPVRDRLVRWSDGALDLLEASSPAGGSRVYLVRGPVNRRIRRILSSRSERQLVVDGAQVFAESGNVSSLLLGGAFRREWAALRRQGMPWHSCRLLSVFVGALVSPLVVGSIAAVLSAAGWWSFFGGGFADGLFSFVLGVSATVVVLLMLVGVGESRLSAGERAAQAWLEDHVAGLLGGDLVEPVRDAPVDRLIADGVVCEVPSEFVHVMSEVTAGGGPLTVDPVRFTVAVWGLAGATGDAHAAKLRAARIRDEVELTPEVLRELAAGGDRAAAEVLEAVERAQVELDEAEDVAGACAAELVELMTAAAAQGRVDQVARALERVNPVASIEPAARMDPLPASTTSQPPRLPTAGG